MGLIKKVRNKFHYYYSLYIEHPACAIFTQCESNQSVMDVLPGFATLLFKEGIVPMMVSPITAPVLLNALKDAICADYHNLEKFATFLMQLYTQPSVISIAQSMLEEYSELYTSVHDSHYYHYTFTPFYIGKRFKDAVIINREQGTCMYMYMCICYDHKACIIGGKLI